MFQGFGASRWPATSQPKKVPKQKPEKRFLVGSRPKAGLDCLWLGSWIALDKEMPPHPTDGFKPQSGRAWKGALCYPVALCSS